METDSCEAIAMDESTRFTPQAMRLPFADATNRLNAYERLKVGHYGPYDDGVKSPDRMSITASPLSPKGNTANGCLSPLTESQAGSNRNSISAASIISGKGKRKTHVGPWQLGRTLGKGATGRVRLAKHAVTGQTAAVKIVSKKSAAMVQSESIAAMDRNARDFSGSGVRPMPCGIEREVVIMKLIEHPNVISLYDVWENRGELYLVLEYVDGGELFDYVSEQGPLPEEEAVRLFRQIIAGLGYCHRFNICHRDLKPENILLDSGHNIKLADFGMAALQPIGHWLNTSCGSPHYAAPEIIYGRRYRGDKADIWSCGIILYALLTGYLPFDGGDLPGTLRLVKRGEYIIPPELSYEASDLIQRILQKRPEDRISMQGMWMHPLLRKYEKLHQAMSNHPVGPPPPVSVQDCGRLVSSRQEIDIDLLRNLQTLWHDVKPDTLVEKLLSREPTHERMFYNALIRFRDDQLENYEGQPLEYSASDYHHISRTPGAITRRHSSRRNSALRRRSHLSVLKDRRRSGNSFINEPKMSGAVEAYDPPKLARSQGAASEPQYAHDLSRKSEVPRRQSTAEVATPSVTVYEAPEEMESPEKSAFEIVPNKKSRINSVKSLQSQAPKPKHRAGSSGISARSASYKRNISFRHVRNRSQGSATEKSKNSDSRQRVSESSLRTVSDAARGFDMERSPSLPAQPTTVRSVPGVKIPKVRNSEVTWKDDTRKVSHELSQICEEAFNASSTSTARTSSRESTETAATSMMASPESSHYVLAGEKPKAPLRDASTAPQRSYTASELAETRRKLIEHSTREGSDKIPAYLSGIITHLDRLIEQNKLRKPKAADVDEQLWPPFDSFVRPSLDAGHLPVINEEQRTPRGSATDVKHDTVRTPLHRTDAESTAKPNRRATVRLVSHSSLGSIEEVKPLNVRKKAPAPREDLPPTPEEQEARPGSGKHDSLFSRFVSAGSRDARYPGDLDPIQEVPRTPTQGSGRSPDKKWSLFRHKLADDKSPKHPENVQPVRPNTAPLGHDTKPSKDPGSGPKTPSEKFGNLFKFMKRKPKHDVQDAAADTTGSPLKTNTGNDMPQPAPQKPARKKRINGKSQNWFARVFQIKPATRVVALDTSNVKGRREVFKILNEWQQYGMEDVYMDKANNYVHGRVGEVNFLRLRPVEFSAEFYTVLEHGQHANLSLARFRQERGAASSFGKVVDTLQIVMKQRNILVEDPARAKKMSKVLDTFPG